MKFDFEILKKASSEQKLKVSEFEIQFKLTLPPIYKLFCQVFDIYQLLYQIYMELYLMKLYIKIIIVKYS